MAEIVWTEPALNDLDAIAEYIALEKPGAAARLIQNVLMKVERLELFPESGRRVEEIPEAPYRKVIVPPCRIIYRREENMVYIVHVLRSERDLRKFMLETRVGES